MKHSSLNEKRAALGRADRKGSDVGIRFLVAGALFFLALSSCAQPSFAKESRGPATEKPERLRPRLDRPAPEAREPETLQSEEAETEAEAGPEAETEPESEAKPEEHASTSDVTPEVAPAPRKRWYGWQNLAVDGAGQTLALTMGLALSKNSDGIPALTTALATYALGGPIVHFAHGNVAKGFGSFGLRVGLPPLGAFTGAMIERQSCGDDLFCGLAGGFLGLVTGTLSAIAIDAGALAYDEVPPPRTAKAASGLESLVVLPSVSRQGAGVSLNAAF